MAKDKFKDANGEGPNIRLGSIMGLVSFRTHVKWGAHIIILGEGRGIDKVGEPKVAQNVFVLCYKDI